MASPDPPVQQHPKVRLDWSCDFSFAHKPAREAPFSPGVPSPRTALPHAPPGDTRQDATVKEESRVAPGVVGRVMFPLPPSPLSPVHRRERRQPGGLVIDVPRAGHPYSLPPIQTPLPTPETARTQAASPIARGGAHFPLPFGLPESEAARLDRSLGQRESAPVTGGPANSSTIHFEILQLREHLRSLGPVYLGNISAADVLVQAVDLRRNSLPDSPSGSSPSIKEEPYDEDDAMGHDTKPPHTPNSSKFGKEIFVRARVRPLQPDHRPFLIQRKFNLDELRATIPDPSPLPDGHSLSRKSSIADLGSPYASSSTLAGPPPTPLIGCARRRSTSAKHGPVPFSPRGRRTPSVTGAEVKVGSRAPANLMPIHLEYARSYLPVLAALLLSGHIHEGDVLDVPLPHPRAWPQTVEHVYTGQGELSRAVRENILYLGGKI